MSNFESLGLKEGIVETLSSIGFETPTPIQSEAIPKLLANDSDIIALAHTGTGKTAAYGLPIIQLVDKNRKEVQAVILSPTRELCLQIANEMEKYSQNERELKVLAVYGGSDIVSQMKALRKGVHVVVATPGRLRDLIRRKALRLDEVDFVVLDEADEMLNMGFREEIDDILSHTSNDKLTWLFSATMPSSVRRIVESYMSDPVEINVGGRNEGNENISHQYVTTRPNQRYDVLRRFIDFSEDMYAVVFTRTRRDSKELAEKLLSDGYRAEALHGDLNQNQRNQVMNAFRNRRFKILVATDVAARGIDVDDLTHVFHYNIPDELLAYNHRSGRTGRAGNKGLSIVLMHPRDQHLLKKIEKIIGSKFESALVPTKIDIASRTIDRAIENFEDATVGQDLEVHIEYIFSRLDHLSKEDIIKKWASLTFNKELKKYRKNHDFANVDKGLADVGHENELVRVFINIGKLEVANEGEFLGFLRDKTKVPKSKVSGIKLSERKTFFELPKDIALTVISKLDGKMYHGRRLRANAEKAKFDARSKKRYSKKPGEKFNSRNIGKGRKSFGSRKKKSRVK